MSEAADMARDAVRRRVPAEDLRRLIAEWETDEQRLWAEHDALPRWRWFKRAKLHAATQGYNWPIIYMTFAIIVAENNYDERIVP